MKLAAPSHDFSEILLPCKKCGISLKALCLSTGDGAWPSPYEHCEGKSLHMESGFPTHPANKPYELSALPPDCTIAKDYFSVLAEKAMAATEQFVGEAKPSSLPAYSFVSWGSPEASPYRAFAEHYGLTERETGAFVHANDAGVPFSDLADLLESAPVPRSANATEQRAKDEAALIAAIRERIAKHRVEQGYMDVTFTLPIAPTFTPHFKAGSQVEIIEPSGDKATYTVAAPPTMGPSGEIGISVKQAATKPKAWDIIEEAANGIGDIHIDGNGDVMQYMQAKALDPILNPSFGWDIQSILPSGD